MSLTEEDFDRDYQDTYADLLANAKWTDMIELCKTLILTKDPTPYMRIELLSGIAMAQVGMATDFTRNLEQYGKSLRDMLSVNPDEAKQVLENVLVAAKLNADGLGTVTFPEGKLDAPAQ